MFYFSPAHKIARTWSSIHVSMSCTMESWRIGAIATLFITLSDGPADAAPLPVASANLAFMSNITLALARVLLYKVLMVLCALSRLLLISTSYCC